VCSSDLKIFHSSKNSKSIFAEWKIFGAPEISFSATVDFRFR